MNKVLRLALLGVLVFPFVANASWWNPLTWSWNNTNQGGSIEENTPNVDIPSSTITETAPVSDTVLPTKTVVETKYVSDPALSLQVQELMKENEALNIHMAQIQKDNTNQVKGLTVELNQCKSGAVQGILTSPKELKLEEIDNEMDNYLSLVYKLETSFGSIEKIPDSFTLPSVDDINSTIDAYKIVDPSFSVSKLPTTVINRTSFFVNYLRTYRKNRVI